MSNPTRKSQAARRSLIEDFDLNQPSAADEASGGEDKETKKPSKTESKMVKTTAYFSRAVHDKLREIAFTERKSINDLVIEGLDKMLAERSYPSTKVLTERAKES